MYTWKELADKFEELQKPLGSAYISVQWGSTEMPPHIKNITDGVALSKFKKLASIAGKKLEVIPKNSQEAYPEVFEESNHYRRWLVMLWKYGPGLDSRHASQEAQDGEIVGTIYNGTIKKPAQESANFCMDFVEYDTEELGKFEWLWDKGLKDIALYIAYAIIIAIASYFGLSHLFG